MDKTIEAFKKADIKVWVLTGDKLESAVNIAMSCKLINTGMERFILDQADYNGLLNELDGILDIERIFKSSDKETSYFLSGPPTMIRSMKKYLLCEGVNAEQVRTDDWE